MSGNLVARAQVCWNGAAPDWVLALAAACARQTQREVAERVGYSHTVIGQVVRGVYPKRTAKIEAAVRGALMSATVACPALGEEIGAQSCVAHQARKRASLGANPEHVRLYRACRGGCPHSFLPENKR